MKRAGDGPFFLHVIFNKFSLENEFPFENDCNL
jgi:hypothetical protein